MNGVAYPRAADPRRPLLNAHRSPSGPMFKKNPVGLLKHPALPCAMTPDYAHPSGSPQDCRGRQQPRQEYQPQTALHQAGHCQIRISPWQATAARAERRISRARRYGDPLKTGQIGRGAFLDPRKVIGEKSLRGGKRLVAALPGISAGRRNFGGERMPRAKARPGPALNPQHHAADTSAANGIHYYANSAGPAFPFWGWCHSSSRRPPAT